MDINGQAYKRPEESAVLMDDSLGPVSGGMNEAAIIYAQTATVCCPRCHSGAIHVMWYSVTDNTTYYCCPDCGQSFYGRVLSQPALAIRVTCDPPPCMPGKI